MALWKRGKWYWTDFSVNGQRYRVSLRSQDRREALTLEKAAIAEADRGKLTASGQSFARLAFSEAADRYLSERLAYLAPLSIRTEKERAKNPKDYFGATPLCRINLEGILAYIAHRKAHGMSNRTINMEVALLRRLLKRAKRLHLVADDLKALPERRDTGRALSYDEKLRLTKTASSRPEWENARLAMTLALNTTHAGSRD